MNRQTIDKPWLKRRLWQEGRIKNNTFRAFVSMLSLWVVSALVYSYLVFIMASTLFEGSVEKTMGNILFSLFVFLVLPALMYYFATHVFKARRRCRQWRNCLFELQAMPAYLGAQLQGKLTLPAEMMDGDKIYCSVGCFRKRARLQGRKYRKGIPLWESETIKTRVTRGMRSFRLNIDLPKSRPESNWSDPDGHVRWLLSVKTANDSFEDIDYEVPVFFNPYV